MSKGKFPEGTKFRRVKKHVIKDGEVLEKKSKPTWLCTVEVVAGKTLAFGISRQSTRDQYDRNKGKGIAYMRAKEAMKSGTFVNFIEGVPRRGIISYESLPNLLVLFNAEKFEKESWRCDPSPWENKT